MKKQPRQARSRATVEAICDAAARLMQDEGYAAVTTNRVAERAGVSVGSLYEYFPNKQSIVAATLGAALRDIVAGIGRSLHEALALPDQPRAGIDHWIRAIVAALESRAGLLRVALSEVPFLGEIPEARGLSQALEQIVRKGRDKSAGVVRLYDPEASAWLLTSMVWTAMQQIAMQRPDHLSRERLIGALVEMVLRQLYDAPEAEAPSVRESGN
ncbi:TetR/AcrR family transcriptional regulator [Solimonas fluminis]|uniref:TetR/AcrR family transcriptional regulator n=1 Tax=Solimonas fluminis TaxID=2086571 RepID=UPI001A9C5CB4|nr:TetR/AcrR family transcriptional regulator [Solimonas fluminis]